MSNILIDKETAEIINIDLGVAFDQGKFFKTPEIVPFRLTRDIVDGMGIWGFEGQFHQACIHTLRILRDHRELILTLLDVLMFDPLFKWTTSPSRNKNSNDDDPLVDKNVSVGQEEAQRAISGVQQKLEGIEDFDSLSVDGQVNLLVG
jgi:ataxia telangiectasia mutated family protein